jgi:hypothetical protein
MAECGHHRAVLAASAVLVLALPDAVPASDDASIFVMPPVLQLQAANGLSNEDVLRIVARDNLMLTPLEAAMIDAALRLAEAPADTDVAGTDGASAPTGSPRDFRLDALLYFSPSSWSLWLNGDLVTPTSVPQDIRINAITSDYVEIVWLPDPDTPDDRRIFTLSPNQIYSAETDAVTDVAAPAPPDPVLAPDAVSSDDETSDAVAVEEHARPEELTLTSDQVDQLSDLEDALKAQE